MRKHPPGLWTAAFYRRVNPETLTVGFHKAEPSWIGPWMNNTIPDFDIWYVAGGSGALHMNNRWLPFTAGDLLFLRPGTLYQRERSGNGEPFQIYFTHILPFGREEVRLNAALARAWPARISMLHRPELAGIFVRLFEAYAIRVDDRSLAVRGLVLQLLDLVFQELQKAPSAPPRRANLGLLQAKSLIEAEYARALSLHQIASQSGLSASHLSALFKLHLGHPPIEYLVRVRLREAKLLLAKGRPVKEAARAVGFRSQHYFSRAFRKRNGRTPTAFAAQYANR